MDNYIEKFVEDGCVVIPNFLSEEEVASLKQEMNVIVENMDPSKHPLTIFKPNDDNGTPRDEYFLNSANEIRFFYEDGAVDNEGNLSVDKMMALNKVGHALHSLNPVFKKVSFSKKLVDLTKALGFIDPAIVQSMYIFKQPHIGGAVTSHIDATFLYVNPINHLIGFWFPIDDATLQNGCLHFVPGSHKTTHVNRRFVRTNNADGPLLQFEGESEEVDESKFVPAPVEKGSVVLINGLVLHKSAANTSNQPRHAYTFHVVDLHETEWSPLNWLQKDPNNEWPRLK